MGALPERIHFAPASTFTWVKPVKARPRAGPMLAMVPTEAAEVNSMVRVVPPRAMTLPWKEAVGLMTSRSLPPCKATA